MYIALAARNVLASQITVGGTFSYWVRRRHTEIGIRSALGASQAHLLRLVVGQAVSLGGVGAAAGLVLAAGLARYIETQLYAVKPLDWVSFAAALLVMVIAVVAASFAPAMRAAAIDPGRALRENA